MIKQPWWYPLARDPYGVTSLDNPLWEMHIATQSNPAAQSTSRGSMNGARNTYEQMRNVSMVDQARNQGDKVNPYYGKPIPDAGTLLGYQAVGGVVVTGPCGLRHFMRHAEARALASWLMKWSAEEPT